MKINTNVFYKVEGGLYRDYTFCHKKIDITEGPFDTYEQALDCYHNLKASYPAYQHQPYRWTIKEYDKIKNNSL